MLLLAVGTALCLIQTADHAEVDYAVGDVATDDVRVHTAFSYVDWGQTLERRQAAGDAVSPVYDFDATSSSAVQSRLSRAFEEARRRLHGAQLSAQTAGSESISVEARAEVASGFVELSERALDGETLDALIDAGFSQDVEEVSLEFVGSAMRRYVIADRALLPVPSRPLNVIRQLRDGREEIVLEDYEAIVTPEEARRAVSLYALERGEALAADQLRLATAVARTAIQPNFFYNQLLTGERQRDAQSSVVEVENHVKRGTMLVRRGDVLTDAHLDMLEALEASHSRTGFWSSFVALCAFSLLLYTCIYHFASGYMRRFSSSQRDLEAVAFLVLLSLGLGRLTVEFSDAFALSGADPAFASSLIYAAPVAGAAMLARVLVNAETAMVLVVLVAVCLGLMMGQSLVPTVFFMLSGLTAAGGLVETRERMQVLKAGALTAVLNVAVVVLLHLATGPLVGGGISVSALGEPGWDAVMAAAGGVISAMLVLGLVPLFEATGFVTDYKLQELANMNHPLLRQLMLRAPGTYHHSVMVGSLSEAAAEAIGANGLLARVCSYFHDIGKGLRPMYYIENQRDMPNIHDRLPPERSAQFIIAHVVDGLALGKEHRLPQPVLDNIAMHHGTCLIRYFYQKAVEEAGSADLVDESKYRHIGPKPNTKEAGIIHLADKVEAACRTLKKPTSTAVRAKIQEIVNSVMLEGQLDNCPLTVKELYVIAQTFEELILAIHHHRISYPAPGEGNAAEVRANAGGRVITLEIPNPLREDQTDVYPAVPQETSTVEPKGPIT